MIEQEKAKQAFERGVKEKRLNKMIALLDDGALDALYNRMIENVLSPTAEEVVNEILLKTERRSN